MAYTELTEIGTIDLGTILRFPSIDTPIFYPVLLFVIFLIFSLGTFFRELRRESRANILSSLAVGGFVTTIMAFIFSLLGLIQRATVIITLVTSIIFISIYLLTNKN